MNDQEYRAFAENCVAEIASSRHQTAELFLAQNTRFDPDRGVIQFGYGDEAMAEADAVLAGTWSAKSNSWEWSWANNSMPAAVRQAGMRLKELASFTGRPEFAAADAFVINGGGPDELAAIACCHLGGIGVWKQQAGKDLWAYSVLLKVSRQIPEDHLLALAEKAILNFLLNRAEQGAGWFNALRQRFPKARVEVIGADLRGPAEEWAHDLHVQVLVDTNRVGTNKPRNLAGINLSNARLDGAILRGLNLNKASLENASLVDADLSGADLGGASLRGAFLNGANLTRATLDEADLSGAELSRTLFVNVDLSRVKGLDAVHHLSPSEVSFSSLVESKFEIDVKFLRDAGVSKGLIDDLISGQRFESTYQTCFLSYSSRDNEFANHLHASLLEAGIRVFQDRFDFIPGDQLDVQISDAIREHKRLVVVLSPESMKSEWVEMEIRLAWNHDRRSLLPVRLCPIEDIRAWTSSKSGFPDLAGMISILDFSQWRVPGEYSLALTGLHTALKTVVKPAHRNRGKPGPGVIALMMPPQSNSPGSEVIVHAPNGNAPNWPALVCNVWSPLPFAHPALVAIVPANGSARSLAHATQVAQAFTRALISLHSAARPAACSNNNLLTCKGHNQTATKRVLVLVGDGYPAVDTYHAIGFWHANAGSAGYAFLPVCPNGRAQAMQTGIPAPLDQIKIREWDKSPAEIVPDIFRSAGLVSSDYRVFISYRQKDAGDYAEQLFAALTRRGYDVFLDRVRIAFGGSIPESIEEELIHKSVLLVLETSKVHRSTWVIREIATAAMNRMAILALNFPNAPHLPVLSNRRRLPVTPADLTAGKRLNAAALESICDRVAALQDFWLTRRRFQLQSAISKVLAKKGIINQQFTAEGHLNVVPNWAPQTVCSIGASPRLPEIADFRDLDHSLAPPNIWQRSIVARGAASQGRRQSDIRWLADNVSAPWYDEGELPLLASRLAVKSRPADGLKR